nr:MAG TPA: hypothetical protein [Caudoviricetes sp.]
MVKTSIITRENSIWKRSVYFFKIFVLFMWRGFRSFFLTDNYI